jgi:hypothetical protein
MREADCQIYESGRTTAVISPCTDDLRVAAEKFALKIKIISSAEKFYRQAKKAINRAL